MKPESNPPSQVSFLTPEDAGLVHFLRHLVAEASRLYEVPPAQALRDAPQIRSVTDAYECLRREMESFPQEQFRTLNLNTKNRVISSTLIYQGTLDTTFIRVVEVFRPAILANAAAIIMAHNHPSGDPTPSPEDAALTRELVQAGTLLGVDVMDHIIIGKDSFVSLREKRIGFK